MVEPLDLHVRLLLNGWVDITGDVRAAPTSPGGLSIRSGTSVEGQQPEPGSLTFLLNNCDGRYSPRNPTGPYYGFLQRNTPIQVYIDFPAPTLRSVSTQESGDVEEFTVAAPAGVDAGDVLVAFQSFATPPSEADLRLPEGGGGWRRIEAATDGSGVLALGIAWWKVALAGEPANYTFFNPDGGESIVAIAAVEGSVLDQPGFSGTASSRESGATTLVNTGFASSAGLADFGLWWAAGIPAGAGVTWTAPGGTTEQADLNDSDAVTGSLATATVSGDVNDLVFTASGNVTNGHGMVVLLPSRSFRFYGEVAEWPPRGDCSDGNLWVPITAGGVLRRLNRDSAPLSSMRALYQSRTSSSSSGVWAYWPLEDGSDATSPASGIASYPAMATFGDFEFAGSSRLFGSLATIVLQSNAQLRGTVPSAVSDQNMNASALFALQGNEPDNNAVLMTLQTTGSAATWRVIYNTGFILSMSVFDEDGVLLDTTGTFDFSAILGLNQRFLLIVSMNQSGSDVNYSFNVTTLSDDHIIDQNGVGDTVTSETVGFIASGVIGPGLTNVTAGHFGIGASGGTAGPTDQAIIGYFGELATDRMRRLLSATGVELYADFAPVVGLQFPFGHEGSIPMGEEGARGRMSKLQEAVETDRGILYEDRDRSRLVYRTPDSLYSQNPTAPLLYGDLAAPLDPIEDDLLTANDITVTQRSGSSFRIAKESGALSTSLSRPGVGTYAKPVSVSAASDLQLPQIANWVLRIGTWDEFRFDRVATRNLAILECPSDPVLIRFALALDPGDVISLDNLPTWISYDPIRTLVRGRNEELDKYRLLPSFSTVPADPYTVGILQEESAVPEEDAPARYSSQGSELATGLLLPGASGDYASTPDAAHLRITGDIDIRADIHPVDWTGGGAAQTILARRASGTNVSYILSLSSTGALVLTWSADGTATLARTSTALPETFERPDGSLAVRATLDVNNGSGGHTVTFYYGDDAVFGPWTQLGSAVTTAGTTSIFAGTSPLEVGSSGGGTLTRFDGVIYQVYILDGILNFSSVAASPDFQDEEVSGFTDSVGNVWTVNGNASLYSSFVAGTDTTLFIRTTLGPLWTTSPGGNFDIRVSGVRLRVTAIGAAVGQVQAFTVEQAPVNGVEKTIEAGTEIALWTPAAYAL